MQSVQLSHEELLLLLGVLRLPMPLALGEQPTAGHDERTLGIALASAMNSLKARALLLDDGPGADPRPVPELCELVAASALAERCLLVAERRGEQRSATHYSRRRGRTVVHTSPRPGVHRLSWLAGDEPAAALLVASVAPCHSAAAPLDFALGAGAFGLALDALAGGQVEPAVEILRGAGAPGETAESFAGRAGPDLASYAILCLSGLQGPSPAAESAMVVRGAHETWYVTDLADEPGRVRVETASPEALAARLHALALPFN
jgi:hypothetical protein